MKLTKTSLKAQSLSKQFNSFTALSSLNLELEVAKYVGYSVTKGAARARRQRVIQY